MSANRVGVQFSRFAILAVAICTVLVIIGLVATGLWILRDLETLGRRDIILASAAIAAGTLLVAMALAWLHAYRSLLRSKAYLGDLLHSRAESERALAQRAAEMRERDLIANTASLRLSDAVNSLNDGFVLWDKDDRLAICNEHYRKLYPKMADLSVAGRHFEDIIRGAIARGLFPEAVGREDAFVTERIARHKSSDSTVVHQLEDGRWIRISKHHTAEGGVVSLHADITEQKSAELAARAAHESLKSTSQQLEEIVRHAVDGVTAIKSATARLARGSGDLSERTEEQVTSLEEMAAAMRELTETLKNNTGNAQKASSLADATRRAAESGGVVAADAVEAMGQIEVSSRRIADIIGMIEEIAFQTNLLALNAAVEAARAGDAGRGFAVVAQEVRALSMRASEASREIRTLITESSGQVGEGVALVRKAGQQLGDIVGSVKQVASIVGEMASAIQEQSSGMQLVADTVTDMETMTQKNAAMVESSTAALNEVDSRLATLIGAINAVQEASGDVSAGRKSPDRAVSAA